MTLSPKNSKAINASVLRNFFACFWVLSDILLATLRVRLRGVVVVRGTGLATLWAFLGAIGVDLGIKLRT